MTYLMHCLRPTRSIAAATVAAFVVAATLFASITPAAATTGAGDVERAIVTLETRSDTAAAERAIDAGPGDADRIGPRVLVIEAPATTIDDLAGNDAVVRVEADQRARATALPNDPCATTCMGARGWHLDAVRAEAAWMRSHGDGITIAVLDTGVDTAHADLSGKIAGPAIDATGLDDGIGTHGTAVAGLAAAATNNGVGVSGLGWNARILPVKVLDANGDGWVSWITAGIYQATDRGARVINMSLSSEGSSTALAEAVAYAQRHGVVVVAAAGNEGTYSPRFPAAIPGVVGVAAVDSNRALASFSNRGVWVDVAAPGVSLPTTVPGGYATFSGTSAATPIVAGTVALVLAQEPAMTPATMEQRLRMTGAGTADGSGIATLDAAGLMQVHAPYGPFRGGMRVARGDVDGDGISEIITGAGPGGGPHVLVLDEFGTVRASFFAYSPGFTGGVDVAAADLDGDGRAEIITGTGAGGGPHVRSFRGDGTPIGTGFMAYDPAFAGGVNVAAADLDGDGRAEIITGPALGGGPHVRTFNASGAARGLGFLAYDPNFTGGIDVAAGDLDGDGRGEIVSGAGAGGGPHIQVFAESGGAARDSFFAYSPGFTGGVRVGVGDADGDGRLDILTGAGPGGGPHARGLRYGGGEVLSDLAFGSFGGGIDVAGAADGTAFATLPGDGLLRTFTRHS